MEEQQDKSLARNQLIAMLLMGLVLVVTFQFFMPKPAPVSPDQQQGQTAETPSQEDQPAQPAEEALNEWPFLPPPALDSTADDEVILEDDDLRLVFTRVGARLKQAHVKLHHYGESELQLVPQPVQPEDPEAPPVQDADVVYPLGLQFTDGALGDALNSRRFEVARDDAGQSVTFTMTLPNAARITKTFRMTDARNMVTAEVSYENLEPIDRALGIDDTPAYWFTWAPNVDSKDLSKAARQSVIWRKEGKNESLKTSKLKGPPRVVQGIEWLCIRSAYFIVAMNPQFEGGQCLVEGNEDRFTVGVATPQFEVKPGETQTSQFDLYIGPSQRDYLAAAWPELPSVVRFFSPTFDFMDKFAKGMLWLLNAFYSVIPNYGLAIIFVTVLVRMALFPLTLKGMKSMKRMQALAPEMQELKEKYGEDPQEMNKRMMQLYKERGVNPVGGCLPMLLQAPVFIAFYRMLWSAYELRGAPFTIISFGNYQWVRDLSEPDRLLALPFMEHVPFLGEHFTTLNLLPILMAASMVLHQKVMPVSGPAQNDQQKIIMTVMPVFFGFITYNMAAGLNLYILTSTVLGMVQQKLIPAQTAQPKPEEIKKNQPRKKKHFYAAAREKKRRLEKEAKQQKKPKQKRS